MRRRASGSLVALLLLFLLAGCRADIVVAVSVEPDGSGEVQVTVAFDRDVVEAVPDLDQILRLDDVRSSGWDTGQSRDADGLTVRLTKSFESADQLSVVLSEIDGESGLFGPATLDTYRNGAMVGYRLDMTVRLDRRVLDLIDPSVAPQLDGEPFGVPIAELEARANGPLDEAVSLVVMATVPGGQTRLPAAGSVMLSEGGVRTLSVVGEIVDPVVAAADAEVARSRQEAADGARLMWLIWGLVGLGTVLGLIVVALWRRRPLW